MPQATRTVAASTDGAAAALRRVPLTSGTNKYVAPLTVPVQAPGVNPEDISAAAKLVGTVVFVRSRYDKSIPDAVKVTGDDAISAFVGDKVVLDPVSGVVTVVNGIFPGVMFTNTMQAIAAAAVRRAGETRDVRDDGAPARLGARLLSSGKSSGQQQVQMIATAGTIHGDDEEDRGDGIVRATFRPPALVYRVPAQLAKGAAGTVSADVVPSVPAELVVGVTFSADVGADESSAVYLREDGQPAGAPAKPQPAPTPAGETRRVHTPITPGGSARAWSQIAQTPPTGYLSPDVFDSAATAPVVAQDPFQASSAPPVPFHTPAQSPNPKGFPKTPGAPSPIARPQQPQPQTQQSHHMTQEEVVEHELIDDGDVDVDDEMTDAVQMPATADPYAADPQARTNPFFYYSDGARSYENGKTYTLNELPNEAKRMLLSKKLATGKSTFTFISVDDVGSALDLPGEYGDEYAANLNSGETYALIDTIKAVGLGYPPIARYNKDVELAYARMGAAMPYFIQEQ